MKLDAFEKLIRKVVREEIDYALQREIRVLKEDLAHQPTQQRVVEQSNPQAAEEFRSKLRAQMPPPSFNTGNTTLNDLLQETAMSPTMQIGVGEPIEDQSSTNHLVRDYSQLMEAIEKKKDFRP